MRCKFIFPLLIMAFMLCACQETQTGQLKIGVVDGERLMRDSVPGQEAMKFIESQQNAMQATLADLQDKMEKNPADEAIQQEFQKAYASSIQKLQAEAQNAANLVQDVIKNTLVSFRGKNGYDMLIYSEVMAAYSAGVDVTAAVLAEVNNQKVEFKPLPDAATAAPGMAEQPAQAPAATSEPPAAKSGDGKQ